MLKSDFCEKYGRQLATYRALLAQMDKVDAVATQFDGKVLNKRFFDALDAASDKTTWANGLEVPMFRAIRPSESYESHAVELWYNGRNYDSELRSDRLYLRNDNPGQYRGTDKTGRIKAEYWHKGTKVRRQYYREMIYRIEDAIANYDRYTAEIKALEEEIARREREINPIFRKADYSIPAGEWIKDHHGELGGYFAREKAAGLQE